MPENFDDIPERALDWHQAGRGAVLATVVQTWGSAPRPVGSQLAISGDGEIAGSVSGGCIEGAVILEALELLRAARHGVLEFGVSDETAFDAGLACGGTIRILLEPVGEVLPEPLLSVLVAARKARCQIAYVVDPDRGARRLADQDDPVLGPALAERFRKDASGFEGDSFVAIHNPPLRMVVVGAVHIAQPLAAMARLTGFDVTLVDPRPVFGSAARFPGEVIEEDWPDAALARHGLDARTAVITLTHDPKLDDPAIETALAANPFYIGCLGSKRTQGQRVARLRDRGFGETAIARIHGPVGLDIGALSPAEIAVSILAEVVAVLRKSA